MARFVVLLRGVNVGKGNRVPMADFKRLLESLGCTDVKTLLNSGNAVFTNTARSANWLADRIRQGLGERFHVTTPVVVKAAADLEIAMAECPWPPAAGDESKFLVVFTGDNAALSDLTAIKTLAEAPDRFAIGGVCAYLYAAGGLLESPAGAALLGRAGQAVTTRNWATVQKLKAAL